MENIRIHICFCVFSSLREEVARFLTYYCKAPAPLKAENVGNPVSIGVCSHVLPFFGKQLEILVLKTNDLVRMQPVIM